MEKFIVVDDTQWNMDAVSASASEKEFVDTHMSDPDVYKYRTPEKKEASLKLVYSICVPAPAATSEPEKEKTKRK